VPVLTVATDFLFCTASKPTHYTVDTSDSSGRDSSVGVSIRYGLDGRGSNPGWGDILDTCPEGQWAPSSVLKNWYRVFPGGKMPGSGVDNPPQFSAEVKERVEIYIYSTSWSSWPVLG